MSIIQLVSFFSPKIFAFVIDETQFYGMEPLGMFGGSCAIESKYLVSSLCKRKCR